MSSLTPTCAWPTKRRCTMLRTSSWTACSVTPWWPTSRPSSAPSTDTSSASLSSSARITVTSASSRPNAASNSVRNVSTAWLWPSKSKSAAGGASVDSMLSLTTSAPSEVLPPRRRRFDEPAGRVSSWIDSAGCATATAASGAGSRARSAPLVPRRPDEPEERRLPSVGEAPEPDRLLPRLRSPSRPRRSPRRRSRRSTLGRGAVGRTRARTCASARRRPNKPFWGCCTTSISASRSSTPNWSRADSTASETVRPVVKTHSTGCLLPLLLLPRAGMWLRTRRRRGLTLARCATATGGLGRLGGGLRLLTGRPAVAARGRGRLLGSRRAAAGGAVALGLLARTQFGHGLLRLDADRVLAAVERAGDEGLLADPPQGRDQEIDADGRRADEREEHVHQGADAHHHALLLCDLGASVAAHDLLLLIPAQHGDDRDQREVGQRGDEADGQRLARRLGQIEVVAEGVHLVLAQERLVQLGVVAEVLRAEPVGDRAVAQAQVVDVALQAHELGLVGQPSHHVVEDREDRRLDEQRQAAAHRVDLVLLVEAHQLFVELLPVVLVLHLQPADLGLQPLHLDHRARALEGQRRRDDHHDAGQQCDGDRVVGNELVEEVEQARDELEEAV